MSRCSRRICRDAGSPRVSSCDRTRASSGASNVCASMQRTTSAKRSRSRAGCEAASTIALTLVRSASPRLDSTRIAMKNGVRLSTPAIHSEKVKRTAATIKMTANRVPRGNWTLGFSPQIARASGFTLERTTSANEASDSLRATLSRSSATACCRARTSSVDAGAFSQFASVTSPA